MFILRLHPFTASALALALLGLPLACPAQPAAGATTPPRSWVDKDTGHRVWRLSDEPNSGGFYFNINAYTPDSKQMVYTAPDGIHVMDMATLKTKLLVANPPQSADAAGGSAAGMVHTMVVGHKTNSVFYTATDKAGVTSVYKADTNSGAVTKLVDVPHLPNTSSMSVVSVNADETLVAGTYIEGGPTGKEYGAAAVPAPAQPAGAADNRVASAAQGPHYQPANKGQMMAVRLAAKLPLVLFTLRLEPGPNGAKPGDLKVLLHSTDWINHLLFSPSDPELLMYCHEGAWQEVDRIWMIHTDATHNTLIHPRTMLMEIAGHEFWGLDGETIWYDWQYPKGEDFFLAGYNLKTGQHTAYHMQRDEWSIHFNLTKDLDLFCGDGGDPGQVAKARDGEWIELFHPQLVRGGGGALNSPTFWQPGVFHSEHLVNMSHHNYREEPNVRFSPDKKLVIFTSNMFGPAYVFGVEVAKADNPPVADVQSTPELARKFNPVDPPSGNRPAAAIPTPR
ncbi:MAG TPA: oligogalacturonate lyase family protein [Acidobacteriaceae bacterium]|jgi:oligogalacturonide lyase|nr:oligogalacturonate lyase family protein [Acidobacteriaceae bacterium]